MPSLSAGSRETSLEPHRPALILSAVGLGYAIHINYGFHTPVAIRLVVASLVLAWAALLIPRILRLLIPDRDSIVIGLLVIGVAVQLATLMMSPFAMYTARPLPRDYPWFVPLLMAAAIAAAIATFGARWLRAVALAGLVLANVGLGVITFKASPDPAIDLVTVHREAFKALEAGTSPYSMTWPDIYKGNQGFYPPGSVKGGVVQFGYTYPFGSLLMAWPGQRLAGDFRYAELAALGLGAIAIACAGQMTSVAVLAMALLLFTPRVFFELEQAWTEPFGVLWLGVALWAWRARWMRLAMLALALLVTVKQYLVVAVPLAWLSPTGRLRAPIVVGLIVCALYAPVFVWDFDGFVRSVLMVQVNEKLRTDALSLAVNYARWAGHEMSAVSYGAIVLAALGLAAWRAPATPAGYAAALAVVLFTSFAFGKKAFCNYYFFVIAVLCASIAVNAGGHEDESRHP